MSYSKQMQQISHIANADTVKAQAAALASIGLLMRQSHSQEALRNQHEAIMADLQVRLADIEAQRTRAEAHLNSVYPCQG